MAYSVAFVAVFCQPILGQVKDIKRILLEKHQEKPQSTESSDDAKNRLTQWQKDARQTLTKLEDSATVLPKDVTLGDVEDYRRDAEQVAARGRRGVACPQRRRRGAVGRPHAPLGRRGR